MDGNDPNVVTEGLWMIAGWIVFFIIYFAIEKYREIRRKEERGEH
jgi:hypothetical protein